MNRIEEIKKRVEEYSHFVNDEDALIGNVGCNLLFGDIYYLLSKLEIAEKALIRISADSTFPEDCQGIATEALQQIRS